MEITTKFIYKKAKTKKKERKKDRKQEKFYFDFFFLFFIRLCSLLFFSLQKNKVEKMLRQQKKEIGKIKFHLKLMYRVWIGLLLSFSFFQTYIVWKNPEIWLSFTISGYFIYMTI
jgi:hypothetical protein